MISGPKFYTGKILPKTILGKNGDFATDTLPSYRLR
jgi:hypothetical protein